MCLWGLIFCDGPMEGERGENIEISGRTGRTGPLS